MSMLDLRALLFRPKESASVKGVVCKRNGQWSHELRHARTMCRFIANYGVARPKTRQRGVHFLRSYYDGKSLFVMFVLIIIEVRLVASSFESFLCFGIKSRPDADGTARLPVKPVLPGCLGEGGPPSSAQ